jgi:hypothetical protein
MIKLQKNLSNQYPLTWPTCRQNLRFDGAQFYGMRKSWLTKNLRGQHNTGSPPRFHFGEAFLVQTTRSRSHPYPPYSLTPSGPEKMPSKPNYKYQRAERDRAKKASKETKSQERKEQAALRKTAGPDGLEPSEDSVRGSGE